MQEISKKEHFVVSTKMDGSAFKLSKAVQVRVVVLTVETLMVSDLPETPFQINWYFFIIIGTKNCYSLSATIDH